VGDGIVSERRVVVVGAGVAGLAAALALRRTAPDVEVVVLEAAGRVGGLVETERTPEGFVVEYGADCLVTTKPEGVAAACGAGLGDAIVVGTGTRRTYVATGEGLVPMPQVFAGVGLEAALSVLRTPLLSLVGKARAALEPFVPARREDGDESVRAFMERRFGIEFTRAVVAPLIGGVYGGDVGRLSVDGCLPRLRQFERVDGSVVAGMQRAIRARRRRVRAGEVVLPPTVTLRAGMGSLPDAMAARLGEHVALGVGVGRIDRRAGGGFAVETAKGIIGCDGVVLATAAWQAPRLVERLSADLATELGGVRHKALDCVTFAWPRAAVAHPLDATGWVRATGETRQTLACTWSSQKWPGRAPAGSVLLRSVLAMPEASEAELVDAARSDLRDLIGITAPPVLVRVRRIPRATPIYEVGHATRVARLGAYAREIGALALAGNAHAGVGIPDCVASGETAAGAVVAALGALGTTRRTDDAR
jgi:oxygen-dependent protoporphyrinogen oxidase